MLQEAACLLKGAVFFSLLSGKNKSGFGVRNKCDCNCPINKTRSHLAAL